MTTPAKARGVNLIVEGACRPEPWPWQGTVVVPLPKCERGTRPCYAAHTVRQAGSRCSKCGTDGGDHTCMESDRVQFACSNYAGNLP